MNIGSVNNLENVYSSKTDEEQEKIAQEKQAVEKEKLTSAAASDKLDLSSEAQKLQNIRTKIDEGFYDNPEIIKKTSSIISQKI